MAIIETTEGITKNPYKLIDAINYKGEDASVYPNTNAVNGFVARVRGPNKIIFDSGYFEEDGLIGPHHLDVKWYSNIGSGNGLTIEYWKKDQNGNELLSVSSDIPWHDDISDVFGNSAGEGYFHENNSYRFVIKSHSSVPNDNYIDMDWLKITTQDLWTVQPFSLGSYDSITPYMYTVELERLTISLPLSGGTTSSIYSVGLNLPFDCTYASFSINLFSQYVDARVSGISGNTAILTFKHEDATTWSGTITFDLIIFWRVGFRSI